MRVAHWSILNGSGMHRVAESLAKAETALGLTSTLANPQDNTTWVPVADADIHVVHTHFPPELNHLLTRARLVWVGHGTPDHIYQSTVEYAEQGAYGHSDPLMLMMHWLKNADARVTFWERHKWIYDQMLSRGARRADLVPLGVDLAFWSEGSSAGHFAGEPALLTGENPHYIKWIYDLATALPTVAREHPKLMLHAIYQVRDHHCAFYPWSHAMGASFHCHISPGIFEKPWLRNAFQSTDFYIGLVRYGDLNHIALEANAAGTTTISYVGNPHSDYWVAEGDQRGIARELVAILKGKREKRAKTSVPDIADTARAMLGIYEGIL